MRNTIAAATKKVAASTKNGSEKAASRRTDPSGGPAKVFVTASMLQIRPFAFSSWWGCDDARHDRLVRVVAEHFRHAEQERGAEDEDEQTGASAGDRIDLVGSREYVLRPRSRRRRRPG